MGKVAPAAAPEAIALDSKNQSAFTKAVKKLGKAMKTQKLEKEERYRRGIVLVSHLPHGFFEDELRGFFSQFGKVNRVRLARSPKTGRSKGYAFVEFEFLEIAMIAAESMNNYLMYERLIKCKVLEPKVNARRIFSGQNIRKDQFPTLIRRKKYIQELSEPMESEEIANERRSRQRIIARNNEKLASLGIQYKYEDAMTEEKSAIFAGEPVDDSLPTEVEEERRQISTTPTPTTLKSPKASIASVAEQKVKKERNSVLLAEAKKDASVGAKKRKSKTPEKPKFSPKMLRSKNRKSEASAPVVNIESGPPAKKGRRSVVTENKETPVAQQSSELEKVKTSDKPKTPKILKIKYGIGEASDPVAPIDCIPPSKTERKSVVNAEEKQEPVVQKPENEVETKGVKTPEKKSPKILRSKNRTSKAPTPVVPVESKLPAKMRKSIVNVEVKKPAQELENEMEKKKIKTPEKAKSPKFLRSKNRLSEAPAPVVPIQESVLTKKGRKSVATMEDLREEPVARFQKVEEKQKSKTPEKLKSKFSPKMLRSRTRQSDVTLMPSNVSAPKQASSRKSTGRKSMK